MSVEKRTRTKHIAAPCTAAEIERSLGVSKEDKRAALEALDGKKPLFFLSFASAAWRSSREKPGLQGQALQALSISPHHQGPKDPG